MTRIDSDDRDSLPDDAFAFPEKRKEPLTDVAHIRNAVARFMQVAGVSDAERDAAWQRIRRAAARHGVDLHESDWRDLKD